MQMVVIKVEVYDTVTRALFTIVVIHYKSLAHVVSNHIDVEDDKVS